MFGPIILTFVLLLSICFMTQIYSLLTVDKSNGTILERKNSTLYLISANWMVTGIILAFLLTFFIFFVIFIYFMA